MRQETQNKEKRISNGTTVQKQASARYMQIPEASLRDRADMDALDEERYILTSLYIEHITMYFCVAKEIFKAAFIQPIQLSDIVTYSGGKCMVVSHM